MKGEAKALLPPLPLVGSMSQSGIGAARLERAGEVFYEKVGII